MTKLKWGILGTGNIAHAFARGVKASATGKLVAVGSRTQANASAFGKEFGVGPAGRHASYAALLADPQVQAVYIGLPHPCHAEWAIKAAGAGKHVLCEKPMGLNHAEAMAMFEAAHENNVFMMEAFMYRCHPQMAKVVGLIRSGAIGEVRAIQATFSFNTAYNETSRVLNNALGGGGILDVGCYPVSFARMAAGAAIGAPFAEPVEVKAVGKLNTSTRTDEWTSAVLKFANGIVAQVSTGVQVAQDNGARVYGSTGWIHVPDPWIPSRDGSPAYVHLHTGSRTRKLKIEPGRPLYALEADAVAEAIGRKSAQAAPPAHTWDDTLGNMRTLDLWREQIGLIYDAEKPDAPEMKLTAGRARLPDLSKAKSSGSMRYGSIPHVEKPASRLVLGCDNQRTLPHASVMFDDFFTRGGNVFDTAHQYGNGLQEKLLGQWMRNRGVREQVVLIGKGAHTPFCDPESITRQLLISLERLQTDYVDVYFMHRDNPEVPVEEFVDALNQNAVAGRIKTFGGSNWSIARITAGNAYARRAGLRGFSAISNNFSLARMVDPVWKGCIAASDPAYRAFLAESQLVLMPWSSQARGFFLDDSTPAFNADEERVRCWFADDNFERLRRARELAAQKGFRAINIALAYVLDQPFPTFPLIGPRLLSETRTSLESLTVTLTPDEVKWLNLEA
ncbi:MAG: aldo/keto reductase [Thermoflexales bacterium]